MEAIKAKAEQEVANKTQQEYKAVNKKISMLLSVIGAAETEDSKKKCDRAFGNREEACCHLGTSN